MLESLRPRVAIIDLALTELEGMYVIEQSLDFQPPILLCITDFSTDYVVQTLQDLGVGYIKTPFVLKDGYIETPKGPGLGVELDEKALADKIYDGKWTTPRQYYEDGSNAEW